MISQIKIASMNPHARINKRAGYKLLGLGYQYYISYHPIGFDFPTTYLCSHHEGLMAMQRIQIIVFLADAATPRR